MRIPQLEAFLRVASTGSFSKAAVVLGITQPSVSARIAGLEDSVGHSLFVRSGHRMLLTEGGHRLLPIAEEIVRLAQEARSVARRGGEHSQERIRIGTNASSAVGIVPRLLAAFRRRRPGVQLTVRSDSTHSLMPLLAEGELELAFVNPTMADFRVKTLWTYSRATVLACPSAHPLTGESVSDLESLRSVAFVAYSVGPAQEALAKLRQGIGGDLRIAMESNSTEICAEAIRSGAGVGFLPRDVVSQLLLSGDVGVIRLPDLRPPDWDVACVQWQGRSLAAPASDLVNLLRHQGRDILGSGGADRLPEPPVS